METAYFIKTGILKPFSEQQLVDCDQQSSGCNGGHMTQAYDHIKINGDMQAEDYLYTAKEDICK